jgi:hypothetical protein
MAESYEFLQQYRDNMDPVIEELGVTLGDLGYTKEGLRDSELVEVATRKLRTMHKLLLCSGMNENILKAVMAE